MESSSRYVSDGFDTVQLVLRGCLTILYRSGTVALPSSQDYSIVKEISMPETNKFDVNGEVK